MPTIMQTLHSCQKCGKPITGCALTCYQCYEEEERQKLKVEDELESEVADANRVINGKEPLRHRIEAGTVSGFYRMPSLDRNLGVT